MSNLVYVLLAAGAGGCLALQASANTRFRANLGDNPLFASFFSICGTVATAGLAMLVLRPPAPTAEAVRQTEWWNWVGGPLGALVVLSGAALVSKLDAALFIACVVAGQLLAALLLDHFGLMGLKHVPLSPGRVVGALLVLAGVVCVKYL